MLTKKKKERLYGFSVQFSAMAAVFLYILFFLAGVSSLPMCQFIRRSL
ncbi:hypothetical protein RUMHYD_03201 [Blautia hydrogenotrophica DSM 10507]|uniref:Uncharacterized protein n=1 Tax=Blautia hydrogenotrophica (strain DSM 10507 / JCM 14656 / S5a33) TaxID=476272 RepID=C0CQN8_BLAHS|nr:hypothetical protein RUMHYD_03201 [Blautia hydrogenotrophica DSM 10507]